MLLNTPADVSKPESPFKIDRRSAVGGGDFAPDRLPGSYRGQPASNRLQSRDRADPFRKLLPMSRPGSGIPQGRIAPGPGRIRLRPARERRTGDHPGRSRPQPAHSADRNSRSEADDAAAGCPQDAPTGRSGGPAPLDPPGGALSAALGVYPAECARPVPETRRNDGLAAQPDR